VAVSERHPPLRDEFTADERGRYLVQPEWLGQATLINVGLIVLATSCWRRQQGEGGGEDGADSAIVDEVMQGVGAYIMGRNVFGGGSGSWNEEWKGWWGDDQPYHSPAVTHIKYRIGKRAKS